MYFVLRYLLYSEFFHTGCIVTAMLYHLLLCGVNWPSQNDETEFLRAKALKIRVSVSGRYNRFPQPFDGRS